MRKNSHTFCPSARAGCGRESPEGRKTDGYAELGERSEPSEVAVLAFRTETQSPQGGAWTPGGVAPLNSGIASFMALPSFWLLEGGLADCRRNGGEPGCG